MKSKGNLRDHSPILIRHARVRARFRSTLQVLEKSGLVSRGMYALPAADQIFCYAECEFDPRESVIITAPLHSEGGTIHRLVP